MTITYATAKKLKEFLGALSPKPIEDKYWYDHEKEPFLGTLESYKPYFKGIPAYSLEDLLSKPFCEALALKIWPANGILYSKESRKILVKELSVNMHSAYYDGGMEAVEKALVEMIGK